MALKTSFFIFSCFLLLTNKVYGDNCPPNAHTPAPSIYTPPQSPSTPPQTPTAPPTYLPPVQAPATPPVIVYPPIYTPQPPPASSPVYVPPQSPSSSPPAPESPATYPPLPVTPSPPYKHGFCVVECMKRCKTLAAYTGKTRVCVRLCSHCCKANNKCVPGPATTCPAWDTIVYHGVTVKCP